MSDLKGKVFVVTGATEGIGKEACFDFARRGATLVIVGRNREKTERVATELATAGAESVELIVADMSSLADMRRVAREVSARHDKLDVLVNNAGAVFADYKLSVDGFEQTFALNHLGYFVLTTELLPLLKATAGARIVSTASGAHRTSRIDLSTVAVRPNRRAGFNAYADSKLANILFTRELGRRLAGSGVVATCFHPGFVYTGFGANNPGLFGSAIQLAAKLTARDSKKGAETLIWLATSPDAATGPNGEYFKDKKLTWRSGRAKSDELGRKLWDLSEELIRAR